MNIDVENLGSFAGALQSYPDDEEGIENIERDPGMHVSKSDKDFLIELLLIDPEFKMLLEIHSKVAAFYKTNIEPKGFNLWKDVSDMLKAVKAIKALEEDGAKEDSYISQQSYVFDKFGELKSLLEKPHFQALIQVHDEIAKMHSAVDNLKIVRLLKTSLPLGLSLAQDKGKLYIEEVLPDSLASKGGLRAGDEIIKMNDIVMFKVFKERSEKKASETKEDNNSSANSSNVSSPKPGEEPKDDERKTESGGRARRLSISSLRGNAERESSEAPAPRSGRRRSVSLGDQDAAALATSSSQPAKNRRASGSLSFGATVSLMARLKKIRKKKARKIVGQGVLCEAASEEWSKSRGLVTLIVKKGNGQELDDWKQVKMVRALCEYRPADDDDSRAQSLGLRFDVRSVLEIGEEEDEDLSYVQAKLINEKKYESSVVGIVPTEKRLKELYDKKYKNTIEAAEKKKKRRSVGAGGLGSKMSLNVSSLSLASNAPATQEGSGALSKKKSFFDVFKRKESKLTVKQGGSQMSMMSLAESTNFENSSLENVPPFRTYEEITELMPGSSQNAPCPDVVILTGPSKFDVTFIQNQLLELSPEKYGVPNVHTTRDATQTDSEGHCFISNIECEQMISEKAFLEYGVYGDNMYGTSLSSIQEVVDKGKTCIVRMRPQNISTLQRSSFEPFIVWVDPNQECRVGSHADLSATPAELRRREALAASIKLNFSHLFDFSVEECELFKARALIKEVLQLAEVMPRWVSTRLDEENKKA
eukprot:Nk52_evm75s352 gene=Nk52_evmTU75s352